MYIFLASLFATHTLHWFFCTVHCWDVSRDFCTFPLSWEPLSSWENSVVPSSL